MGFKKWFVRIGAVGGTARWAAKLYKTFKKEYPGKGDKDIYKMMIKARFHYMPDPKAEQFLLAIADDLLGLRALVAVILDVEAGFTDNTPENQQLFLEVIDEELQKKGLSTKVINGK